MNRFAAATPCDTAQRERVLDVRTSFMVQAPAGSGKTTLLVQRYLALLAKSVERPENVVALTFTRKAAKEMRERVLQALNAATSSEGETNLDDTTLELARQVLAQDASRGWHVIEQPERLRAMTLDAFCAELADTQTGVRPPWRLIERPEALYTEAVESLLHAGDASDAVTYLLGLVGGQRTTLVRWLVRCLHQREQWLPYVTPGHRAAEAWLQGLETAWQGEAQDALKRCQDCWCSTWTELVADVWSYAQTNRFGHVRWSVEDLLKDATQHHADAHAAWMDLLDLCFTGTGSFRKTLQAKHGFPAPSATKHPLPKSTRQAMKHAAQALLTTLAGDAAWCEAALTLRHVPLAPYTQAQREALVHLAQLLPYLAAHLEQVFEEAGQSDHTHVTLCALRAVLAAEAGEGPALPLLESAQHWLVDEFQDTSMTHYRLLRSVFHASTRLEDERTVLLVGDPMQSIYRFRQAEVGIFATVWEHGLGEVQLETLVLAQNFRSTAPLVQHVNDSFQGWMPSVTRGALGAIAFSPSQATHGEDVPSSAAGWVRGSVQEPVLLDPDDAEDWAAWVAQVQALRAHHPTCSVAILVRSRRHAQAWMERLRASQFPMVADGMLPLRFAMCVQSSHALLQAMMNPNDDLAWAAVLRAPWVGMPWDDVLTLRHDHNTPLVEQLANATPSALSPEGRQALTTCQRLLTAWNPAALNDPLWGSVLWWQGWWHRLGADAWLEPSEQPVMEAAWAAWLACEAQHGGSYWQHTDTWLHDRYVAWVDPGEHPVQVMTIHQAKGLEFDHVWVVGAQDATRHDAKPLVAWHQSLDRDGQPRLLLAPVTQHPRLSESPSASYLMRLEREKTAYEAQRLAYVAATRARASLTWVTT